MSPSSGASADELGDAGTDADAGTGAGAVAGAAGGCACTGCGPAITVAHAKAPSNSQCLARIN